MDIRFDHFEKHSDHRGDLVVFLNKKRLNKEDEKFGQIYFVTFKHKGVVRGNHYHKYWREWFGVVEGRIEVRLKDINTGEERSYVLDSDVDHYIRLEVGPNVVHAFKSLSDYASLLNYANGEWSSEDTFHVEILK